LAAFGGSANAGRSLQVAVFPGTGKRAYARFTIAMFESSPGGALVLGRIPRVVTRADAFLRKISTAFWRKAEQFSAANRKRGERGRVSVARPLGPS
jgi:hypothetical protein